MRIWNILAGITAAVFLLLAGAVAEGKTPPGWKKGHKVWAGTMPPGFASVGKRKGWHGVKLPPGLAKR
jgi:hypothetical protein